MNANWRNIGEEDWDIEFVDLKENEFNWEKQVKESDYWETAFEKDRKIVEGISKEIELMKNENNK